MKNLILIMIVIMSLASFSTSSLSSTADGEVHVSVNGLVCDFCARALEKVFGKEEAVEGINVDLDTKIITINFKPNQTLSDETLTKLITDAGYNVEKIHRAG